MAKTSGFQLVFCDYDSAELMVSQFCSCPFIKQQQARDDPQKNISEPKKRLKYYINDVDVKCFLFSTHLNDTW